MEGKQVLASSERTRYSLWLWARSSSKSARMRRSVSSSGCVRTAVNKARRMPRAETYEGNMGLWEDAEFGEAPHAIR